jgi:GNAT superfamily N-acetyltransferase
VSGTAAHDTEDVSGAAAVRHATEADLPAIVALLDDGSLVAGKESPGDLAPYLDALREIESGRSGAILVAERAGQVIGVCQLIVFRHLQSRGGRCAEIESMHVHGDFRSQGVGAALLAAAGTEAQAAGCYRVQLTSNVVRADAHRFYEREGFVQSHLGFKRPLEP